MKNETSVNGIFSGWQINKPDEKLIQANFASIALHLTSVNNKDHSALTSTGTTAFLAEFVSLSFL
jgi:hypothetical protein